MCVAAPRHSLRLRLLTPGTKAGLKKAVSVSPSIGFQVATTRRVCAVCRCGHNCQHRRLRATRVRAKGAHRGDGVDVARDAMSWGKAGEGNKKHCIFVALYPTRVSDLSSATVPSAGAQSNDDGRHRFLGRPAEPAFISHRIYCTRTGGRPAGREILECQQGRCHSQSRLERMSMMQRSFPCVASSGSRNTLLALPGGLLLTVNTDPCASCCWLGVVLIAESENFSAV